MNQLKLGQYTFEIDPTTSFLEEYNDDFTKWNLKINTKKGLFEDDYTCAPNLRCENMVSECGSVLSLQNTAFEIPKAYDYVLDEHLFTFYLASHSAVKDNKISFEAIKDGQIEVKWAGIIEDMYFSDAFSTNTPFEIHCTIPVNCLGENEYRSPSVVANKCIDKASTDYDINENILSEIDEITQNFTLDDTTYDRIISFLCDDSFIKTFEGNEKDLEFFIANFTHSTDNLSCAMPQVIAAKAIGKWGKMEGLRGIIEKI